MKHVVVWDPSDEYWEGAIVEEAHLGALEARGVATLPCVPELFPRVGFAGYARRSWGAGWPLDGEVPRATCPIAIFAPGDPYRRIHWKARLVGEKGRGIPLRLAAAEAHGNVIRPTLRDLPTASNAADIANLGDADDAGGWTIGGQAEIVLPGPAMIALCLYGSAPGMRVAWLAATLTG